MKEEVLTTLEDKKNWLEQYRYLGLKLDYNIAQCKVWRDRAENISAVYTNIKKTGSTTSKIEEAVTQIIEHESWVSEQSKELVHLEKDITKAIETVKDPCKRQILLEYYLQHKTYEEIAEKMHYSSRWVRKLLHKGVEEMKISKRVQKVS